MKRLLLVLFMTANVATIGFCDTNKNEIKPGRTYDKYYGNISADATATAVGVSMIGWGVGLAAVITTLAILIPPDEESNNHSHCSSN